MLKFDPTRDLIAIGILLVFVSSAFEVPSDITTIGSIVFWAGALHFVWKKYFAKKKET